MKLLKFTLICLSGLILTSCFEDNDDNAVTASEINDFVWKAMNAGYLYKDEIPDLANNRFSSNEEYAAYLNSLNTPEAIFESLIFEREVTDRFSAIIPDYIAFEQAQQGTTLNNGLEFIFFFEPGSNTEVYGVIRLVLNNSVADNLGLQRGQIFDAIDGVQLTENNLGQLLNQTTYTLNFANYNDNGTDTLNDDFIESTTQQISLTAEVYTENPVHLTEIIPVNGENVGYLVYNGFNRNFNVELNNAFGEFAANNVQHLVLDLRYNPGGSVDTARLLGSMVTGQFNGEVYSKLVYNSDLSSENVNFEFVNNFDGNTINSLNLNKIYVLTTRRSASASELVINSLDAYIDVIQIGENTVGKTQASVTLYDSPTLAPEDINPNHTYALQPLVANSINVNDVAVPGVGLTPDIFRTEVGRDFGTLGDVNELLLSAALTDIGGTGRSSFFNPEPAVTQVAINFSVKPFEEGMYIDNQEIPNLSKIELSAPSGNN
ncbi:MAG: S41 family peptidase [Bacteroidota bacterium]